MYGWQPAGMPGLTIKRRPHFTNIYAPFCPHCCRPIETKKALDTHLAMAHAEKNVHYQRGKVTGSSVGVNRPINVGDIARAGCSSDEKKAWLSGMRRIWRQSGIGHSDLILVEHVSRKPPKLEALFPICLEIMQRGLEHALATAPKRMQRVRDYVRQHLDLVRRIQAQRRFARLRTPQARAKLLVLGLGNPEVCLTYAERAEARRREFRKDGRATHNE
jgi:hypothetical protein